MTDKEIVNADGSRNWEANILFDNLKRLEQENAELRKDIKACNTCEHSTKIYGNEIAELEENIEDLSKDLKVQNEIIGILEAENDKYYQTLQEIKAIAESYIKGCSDCSLIAEPYECEDCTDGGMAKLGKKIIDLITKAEE